jgi:hypothetical protein
VSDSGFIVPPPGLVPAHPDSPAPETVEVPPASFPRFVPVAPPAAPLPTVLPQAQSSLPGPWRLQFDDGQRMRVEGTLVVGRDPAQIDVRPHAERIAVVDPGKSVSKTHALFELDDGALTITDLHSTNGVAIVDADGAETVLPGGGTHALRVGARVYLGDFAVLVDREDRPHPGDA